MAAILPSRMATSRTALIPFLASMTCPPWSNKSYGPCARQYVDIHDIRDRRLAWPIRLDMLETGDDVNLDERIARHAGCRDSRAYRRLRTEAAQEDFVHRAVVVEICKINIALQDFFHGRSSRLELGLNGIQYRLGVRFDITLKMRADSGNEQQITVGNGAAEQRRLLGTFTVLPQHLLVGLFLSGYRYGRNSCSRGASQTFPEESTSIAVFQGSSPMLFC